MKANRSLPTLLAPLLTLAALTMAPAPAGASPAAFVPPTLAQRSPLLTGLWWDPGHDGNGFDVQMDGRDLSLIWYTYRSDGESTWYLAHSRLDDSGLLDTALQEARWGDQGAVFREAGRLRLQRLHSESAQLDWQLDGKSGQWQLAPFRLSGVRVEDDPGGAYHLPLRSGYGLSVQQQDTRQMAIFYAYNAEGRPSWLLGDRDQGAETISFVRYRGTCPGCAEAAASAVAQADARLRLGQGVATLQWQTPPSSLGAEFVVDTQTLQRFTPSAAERLADHGLVRVDDAQTLHRILLAALSDIRNHQSIERGPDFTIPRHEDLHQPGAHPPLREVAESTELVAQGARLYTSGYQRGTDDTEHVSTVRRLPGGTGLAEAGALALAPWSPYVSNQRDLYATDEHLVVLRSRDVGAVRLGFCACPPAARSWQTGHTQIDVFAAGAAAGEPSLWAARLDGDLVESQRIGRNLYLVHRFASRLERYLLGVDPREFDTYLAELAATPFEALLPQIEINGQSTPLVDARQVLLPPFADRRLQQDYVLLTRIAIDDPHDRETLAVLGGVDTTHIAAGSLYLATSRYPYRRPPGAPAAGPLDVHRIDFGDGTLRVIGSATVDGRIDATYEQLPYRMHAAADTLRVITSGDFGALGLTRLTLLAPSSRQPGLLKTVGYLPNAAAPTLLGKRDEPLTRLRFDDDHLYADSGAVQVVALEGESAPRLLGELDTPHYPAWVQRLPDERLLGFDFEIQPSESSIYDLRVRGLKLSLFDGRDPARWRLLDQQQITVRSSLPHRLKFDFARSIVVQTRAPGIHRVTLPIGLEGDGGTWSAPETPVHEIGAYAFDVGGEGTSARLQYLGAMQVVVPSLSDFAGPLRVLPDEHRLILSAGGRFWSASWDRLHEVDEPR